MQVKSQLQTLPLGQGGMLNAGQTMTLVITGGTSDCVLEFLNADDPTWAKHPQFIGSLTGGTGGVLVESVRCVSANMRIRFLTAPTAPYYISMHWDAVSNF